MTEGQLAPPGNDPLHSSGAERDDSFDTQLMGFIGQPAELVFTVGGASERGAPMVGQYMGVALYWPGSPDPAMVLHGVRHRWMLRPSWSQVTLALELRSDLTVVFSWFGPTEPEPTGKEVGVQGYAMGLLGGWPGE